MRSIWFWGRNVHWNQGVVCPAAVREAKRKVLMTKEHLNILRMTDLLKQALLKTEELL